MMLCTCNFLKNNVSSLENKFKSHILPPWHRNNSAQHALMGAGYPYQDLLGP